MDESIRIRTYDGQYRLIGGDFQRLLAFVRGLPKRRFQPSERIWEIPLGISEIQELAEEAGYHVTSDTEMGRALRRPARSAHPRRGAADRVLVRVDGEIKAVVGSAFRTMLDAVKAIEGRRFVSSEKLWELPGSLAEVAMLLESRSLQIVSPEQADDLPATQPDEDAEQQDKPPVQRTRDTVRIRAADGVGTVVGGGFRDMLGAIKDLEGRRFVSEEKLWEIPDTLDSISAFLEQRGYALERVDAEQIGNQRRGEAMDGLDDMPPILLEDDYVGNDQENDDIF